MPHKPLANKPSSVKDGSGNAQNLQRSGLKVTGPRLRILSLFQTEGEPRHRTADDIYQHLSKEGFFIGLATVYRVLFQFEQAGLLEKHHFEGEKAVFELKDDAHHDHLVCLQCGGVEEFHDTHIENRQQKIATELGFVLREHSLALYGDCVRTQCPRKTSKGAKDGG